MESLRATLKPTIRSVLSPVLVGGDMGFIPRLPTTGLLAWIVGGEDSIGLSTADYADVNASVRSIFFSDAETMIDVATAATNALASPLLNTGTMIGTEGMGVALYASDTDLAILRRAYRYFGIPYPEPDPESWQWADGTDMEWSDGSKLESGT